MKEEVLLIQDEELRYVATIEDRNINMRRSKGDIWTSHCKGEDIGTLTDTGNNIKIKMDGIKLKLDYSQFCELFRLMELKMITDSNIDDEVTYVGYEKE